MIDPLDEAIMERRVFVKHAAAALGGATLGARGGAHLTAAAAPVSASSGSPAPRVAGAYHGRADMILRRALVYDGSGRPPFTGDVAVAGDRITAVAEHIAALGSVEIDLDGLALAPGFIDVHSHTDLVLLRDARADSKVRQGVTTEVAGQDGSSVGWTAEEYGAVQARYARDGVHIDFRDLGGFLRHIDRHGAAVNLASMIGAGTVRRHVIGMTDRPATPAEVSRMIAMVQEALAAGACGISSGLEYLPGAFADAAELELLVAPLRGTGLPFASHTRNEDDRVIAAMEEVIGIGHRAGVAIQISHLKMQGERNWWKTDSAFRLIEDARAAGVDVRFDCYPYVAYATGLANLFPVWSREGGIDTFLARLNDRSLASRIEGEVRAKIALLGSWDAVQITGASAPAYGWVAGQKLGTLAQQRGTEPYALLHSIIIGDRSRTQMVGFGMSEENVARKLAHPLGMICSDGGAVSRADGTPHPRNYGTFPRVLGRYCREMGALPVETAIRKMTSDPADRLGFTDRGRITSGAAADLVAFDPQTVIDRATFEDPHQFPIGIPHVMVNGTFVIREGEHTGARPGRAVRPRR
jgi:N-acyl-D-amino-acid deacylase